MSKYSSLAYKQII